LEVDFPWEARIVVGDGTRHEGGSMAGTPRALRISFEFKVSPDLPINVRWVTIEKAMDTIADRVIGLSEGLFPWAKTVKIRKQWVYDWHDETNEVDLPPTDKNTPK
jgi:hypothetical protein